MSDLLPHNATPAERALSEAVARISDTPVPVRGMWDANTCPADLLPWLAWAFSVDEWSSGWTTEQKRAAITRSVFVHRYKGTIGAVREALQALGVSCQVQEWFNQNPPGPPFTFRLVLDANQTGIPQAALQRLLQVVEASKNLRSHLDTVVPGITSEASVILAAAPLVGFEISVTAFEGNLRLDGTWLLDGTHTLDGMSF